VANTSSVMRQANQLFSVSDRSGVTRTKSLSHLMPAKALRTL
jgi:hypothetical protein